MSSINGINDINDNLKDYKEHAEKVLADLKNKFTNEGIKVFQYFKQQSKCIR